MNAPSPIFADFQEYIRQPQYRKPLADEPDTYTAATVRQFLAEYPLLITLLLISVGSVLLTNSITGQTVYDSVIKNFTESARIWIVALPLVVMIEEAIFRSILRLTPVRLQNIAALLLAILLGRYYQTFKSSINEYAALCLVAVWAFSYYDLGLYLKRPDVFARINRFWQANFHWVFYGTALFYTIFKLIDDSTLCTDVHMLLLPVLLGTGLLTSFYFGYIRMKYGFWYAVAVHILLLLASLLPGLISIL